MSIVFIVPLLKYEDTILPPQLYRENCTIFVEIIKNTAFK